MRGERECDRSVTRAELLHHERDREHVESRPAVCVWHGETEQAERRELRQKCEREFSRLVPRVRVRRDLGAYELADGIADQQLVVAVGEVQAPGRCCGYAARTFASTVGMISSTSFWSSFRTPGSTENAWRRAELMS